MIGTRGITTYANRPDNFICIVKPESTPENIHTTDFLANHRIVALPVVFRRPFVGHRGVDRIACLQTEQTAAWLYSGK